MTAVGKVLVYQKLEEDYGIHFKTALYRIETSSENEVCRMSSYKNTVRTSQETHYVSTTESNWLMLCKI
jgi:hypothetical protein